MLPTLVPTADEGVLCVAFSEGEGRPRSKTNPTSALLGPVLKQASTPVLLEGRGQADQRCPWGLRHHRPPGPREGPQEA